MSLLRRRRATPAEFWEWFGTSAELLASQGDPNHRQFRELGRKLKEVHPALTFEVTGNPGGTRELVLSADGRLEGFPAIRALAAGAPSLEHWRVVAFRQPRPTGAASYGGVKLSSGEVWVDPVPAGDDPGKLDLTVHLPDYRPGETHVHALGYLVLDSVLGEVLTATRLGAISWAVLPDDPHAEGLTRLEDLPAVLEQLPDDPEQQG